MGLYFCRFLHFLMFEAIRFVFLESGCKGTAFF